LSFGGDVPEFSHAGQVPDRSAGELLRLLVESVSEYALFVLDREGHIITWNPGAERIKGYRADEIIGRHFSVFYPEEEVSSGEPHAELTAAAEHGSFEDEGWRIRKDGSRFWANVVITAMRDPNGDLVGFAKVTRDLTERKRAEETRRKLTLAEGALRARDEFLLLASHEFRTPVTCLELGIQSMLRRLRVGSRIAGDDMEQVRLLERHVLRLAELVHIFVDVNDAAAGSLSLQLSPFDLRDLLAEAVERSRATSPSQNAAIELRMDGPLLGTWDRKRVGQIVSGLLSNALKYGEGKPVRVQAWGDPDFVRVAVIDEGPGIAAEDHERVFERFERAVPSSHFGGLGIGLWMARQVARAHGGDIELRSAPGKGSAFVLVLLRSPRA
jgi:PAS domain S-box-containing protein